MSIFTYRLFVQTGIGNDGPEAGHGPAFTGLSATRVQGAVRDGEGPQQWVPSRQASGTMVRRRGMATAFTG
ncbi:MAG TPA: hypothetical protein PLV45_00870, partial [bacterium]|nr:hypothetical protein [bacterium]